MQDFKMVRVVGEGSFGKVHLATHLETKGLVAIKIIEKQKIISPDLKARIEAEISVLRTLNHPNIAQLYQIIEQPLRTYLVMEYVEGEDLLEFMKKGHSLKEKKCVEIIRQVLEGLKYMHEQRVCHRDIKLANILLDKKGSVKIIDFGLSKKYEPNKRLKTFCGSPCFAAPELISQLPYLPAKADIWSAGVVLYALLTSSLPFYHYDVKKLYKLVQKGHYQIPASMSKEAVDFLAHTVAINPSTRFTFAEALDHKLIRQYSILEQVEGKEQKKMEENQLQAIKTQLILRILRFNVLLSTRQIEQCLIKKVNKFNSLSTAIALLYKYSEDKLRYILEELKGSANSSGRKGFLKSKPSLTIDASEWDRQRIVENNVTNSSISYEQSPISPNTQISEKIHIVSKAKKTKFFHRKSPNNQIGKFSHKRKQQAKSKASSGNVQSACLEYFGASFWESTRLTVSSTRDPSLAGKLEPRGSATLEGKNQLTSAKEKVFRYIKLSEKSIPKDGTDSIRRSRRETATLHFPSSHSTNISITSTMLTTIGLKASKMGDQLEDCTNKSIGPYNIAHTIQWSEKQILESLRRAENNPSENNWKVEGYIIEQKKGGLGNYGDLDSKEIRTGQFVLKADSRTAGSEHHLKVLSLNGFTDRFLIRVEPLKWDLNQKIVTYIKESKQKHQTIPEVPSQL